LPYLGSTIRIKVTLFDYDGKSLDPDSQEIKIYDSEGTLRKTFDAATYEDAGVYYVDYTIPSDAPTGDWLVIWKIVKGGLPSIDKAYFRVKALRGT